MFRVLTSFLRAIPRSFVALTFGITLLVASPVLAPAQTSGDAGPIVGRVAPGQQAGQIEGTTESALTYAANVILPMIGVAFLIYVVFALRTNRGWVVSGVCAVLCGMISGFARLIEWHIQQGAGGIH